MNERENAVVRVHAGKWFVRSTTLRWILASAALAAFVLVLAPSSQAQSQDTASKSAPAGATAPPKIAVVDTARAVTLTATPPPVAQSAPPAGQSTPKGPHEGIAVHGHWTIEVRNPDGSLVRRVEFENSLDPGFTWVDGALTFDIAGGATYLNALMTGQAGPPAGSWAMLLTGDTGLGNLADTSTAPCVNLPPVNSGLPGPGYGYCLLSQAGPSGFCAQYNSTNLPPAGTSCNLSVNSVGTLPAFTGFQISGTIIATQSGQIQTVATLVGAVCANVASGCFGNAQLGVNTVVSTFATFTSSSSFPGSPVKVTAGQTIAVTVAVSFGSQ